MAAKRKRGRPRGGITVQIYRALPRLQRLLLNKALAGNIEAIIACHKLVQAQNELVLKELVEEYNKVGTVQDAEQEEEQGVEQTRSGAEP